jgi:hypothetical protein
MTSLVRRELAVVAMLVTHLVVAVQADSATSLKPFLEEVRHLVPVMDGVDSGNNQAHLVVKTLKL